MTDRKSKLKLKIWKLIRWQVKFISMLVLTVMVGLIARWYVENMNPNIWLVVPLSGWIQAMIFVNFYSKWLYDNFFHHE